MSIGMLDIALGFWVKQPVFEELIIVVSFHFFRAIVGCGCAFKRIYFPSLEATAKLVSFIHSTMSIGDFWHPKAF
jgi:hypothetical protein